MIAPLHMLAPLQWMRFKTLATVILELQCRLHQLPITYFNAI
jgi:hypothetical protein